MTRRAIANKTVNNRKFAEGDRVRVNHHAFGDSYFVGKVGKIVGYSNSVYEVCFTLPGNGREEVRRLKPYKLSLHV